MLGTENNEHDFSDVPAGLPRGDFSRLEPLFIGEQPLIIPWHREGRFRTEPQALAEALTCACFLGHICVAEYLMALGVHPSAGAGTGLDALHWAANRGQLESVRLLLRHKAPTETRSTYGGTALGTATWSAMNEPRPDHLRIIEELINAGARVEEAGYPTGNEEVDRALRRTRRFECANPILRVEDMPRSIRYYVDVLGFSNAEWGGEDFTLLTRGGAGIYLSQGDQGEQGTWVWLGVDDVGVLHEEYRNAGAIILHPPESMPWAREMKVGDPDGHVLRFGSDPEE